MADLFEYVTLETDKVYVKKYHFHWQNENSQLKKRWDNAPHHKELDRFPDHVHFPDKVESVEQIPNIFYVIGEIEIELSSS